LRVIDLFPAQVAAAASMVELDPFPDLNVPDCRRSMVGTDLPDQADRGIEYAPIVTALCGG